MKQTKISRILPLLLLLVAIVTSFPVVAESSEEEWMNILLLGGDARTTEAYDRTDTMIILSVNAKSGLAKMTSIMRDTWVKIPGKGSGKINTANRFGGPELAMQTVNESFGANIDRYVMVNLQDLVGVIDILGGIDIEITESERTQINRIAAYFLKQSHMDYDKETKVEESGMVHLNGLLTTSYCRIRHSDSDYQRVMRQQGALIALAKKTQDLTLGEALALSVELFKVVETNLTPTEMTSLVKTGMKMKLDNLEQFRIPVDGTFKSGNIDGAWKIVPNFEKNAELLHEFIYG